MLSRFPKCVHGKCTNECPQLQYFCLRVARFPIIWTYVSTVLFFFTIVHFPSTCMEKCLTNACNYNTLMSMVSSFPIACKGNVQNPWNYSIFCLYRHTFPERIHGKFLITTCNYFAHDFKPKPKPAVTKNLTIGVTPYHCATYHTLRKGTIAHHTKVL